MKHLALGLILTTAAFASCNSTGDNTTKTDTKDSTMTSSTTTMAGDSTKKDTSSAMNNASMSNNTGTTSNSTATTTQADAKTIEFVQKAASGGMMEVQLGQVAQQNAKSQRVKDFGSMMNTDHTDANNQLKSLATSKNIQVPSAMNAKDQKHVDEMSKMKGAEFDKMYMNMMVNDHKEDIAEFKKASTDLKDSDIKGFAGKTLPVLQKHLDSAMAIHHKM